ncbi:MAG: nucleotidyltransferase family protein [Clostridia bacterium]
MALNSTICETEVKFLKYLGESLKTTCSEKEIPCLRGKELECVFYLAERHQVLTLLGNILPDSMPEKMQESFQIKMARTIHKAITLQSLSSHLTILLEKEGIRAITLKGYAVSRFYPVPEYRKTSDIDLFFLNGEDAKKAGEILCKNGFKLSKEWHANHHFVLISEKNETVELHTAWADDFKDKHLNKYLKAIQKESSNHCQKISFNETNIYVYDTAWQAFYLIIHMLTHFVGSGFGIRNLCDWVVLWENCDDENTRKDFIKMAQDSGTEKFVKAVNSVCVKYLSLTKEKSPFPCDELTEDSLTDEFLRDILDAGEFGYSEKARMVGMEGNSVVSYVREFHHQMHINFPALGKVALFWPLLWIATLIRFLYNNRKLNRGSLVDIMKKAGSRGQLVKKLTENNK